MILLTCSLASCKNSSSLPGWNTKISARESNYGARIDYILITRGLLPWVKATDIQPAIKGSDHCPVFIDLEDSIILEPGTELRLRDMMHMQGSVGEKASREPPRLAAKHWDEYSGKQMSLEKFFGKLGNMFPLPVNPPISHLSVHLESTPTPSASSHDPNATAESQLNHVVGVSTPSTRVHRPPSPPIPVLPSQRLDPPRSSSSQALPSNTAKRKFTPNTPATIFPPKSKKRKQPPKEKTSAQTKLSTFFAKPRSSPSPPPLSRSKSMSEVSADSEDVDENGDYLLALRLSSQESNPGLAPSQPSSSRGGSTINKQAWTHLLAPIQPPKCLVHGEPAKELTVTKPGLNKGKNFFICAR